MQKRSPFFALKGWRLTKRPKWYQRRIRKPLKIEEIFAAASHAASQHKKLQKGKVRNFDLKVVPFMLAVWLPLCNT
jgi:hypothetical protein